MCVWEQAGRCVWGRGCLSVVSHILLPVKHFVMFEKGFRNKLSEFEGKKKLRVLAPLSSMNNGKYKYTVKQNVKLSWFEYLLSC